MSISCPVSVCEKRNQRECVAGRSVHSISGTRSACLRFILSMRMPEYYVCSRIGWLYSSSMMYPYVGVYDVPVAVFVHLMENDVRVGPPRARGRTYVLRERRVATPKHQDPRGPFRDEFSHDVCDILV